MTADYLACLAMKLLCFVFSSGGGGTAEGWGEWVEGCRVLERVQGHDCVKGKEREKERGGN